MISILISLDESTLENYDEKGTGETANNVALYNGQVHIQLAGVVYIAKDVKAAAKLFADYAWQLDRLTHLVKHSKAHPGKSILAPSFSTVAPDEDELGHCTYCGQLFPPFG